MSLTLIKHNLCHNFFLDFTYQQFGPALRAEFFNATEWAEIVASSGRFDNNK